METLLSSLVLMSVQPLRVYASEIAFSKSDGNGSGKEKAALNADNKLLLYSPRGTSFGT